MNARIYISSIPIILSLAFTFHVPSGIQAAQQSYAAPATEVTPFDLILAMNQLRVSRGLPALVEDPIINAVAQSTAEIMAANQMTWHIGDVSGRLAAAGYGGGSTVWATENFDTGNLSIDEIMVIWSDAAHMIPAVNPAYCHVGAGVARASNGRNYYVLQAAYTSTNSCGEYRPPGEDDEEGDYQPYSQWIVPVTVADPDADGNIYHVVEAGQSFWAIAIAYQITIQDLETWNNLSRESKLQIGQRLFIPGPDTEGYATPTPVGMIQVSMPDDEGKIIHEVQEYQTLTSIAQAYDISISRILTLNNIQVDWPLSIGQKLIIDPGHNTPTPTLRPLTPIEKLTPASDGRYYHTIKTNETLSWIASLYDVHLSDLLAWNGLSESSIIQPEQRLLLHVTPPATGTSTPVPITTTPIATGTSRTTAFPEQRTTMSQVDESEADPTSSGSEEKEIFWVIPVGIAVLLAVLGIRFYGSRGNPDSSNHPGDANIHEQDHL